MNNQKHTVRKFVMDFKLAEKNDSFQFAGLMRSFYYQQAVEIMDEIFSEECGSDEHVFFDRIELDLGRIRYDDFERNFKEKLRSAVKKIIAEKLEVMRYENGTGKYGSAGTERFFDDEKNKTVEPRMLSGVEYKLALIKYFIEHSVLPWWAETSEVDFDLLVSELISVEPEKIKKLFMKNFNEPVYVERIIRQFEKSTIEKIIAAFNPAEAEHAILLLKNLLAVIHEFEKQNRVFVKEPAAFEEKLYRELLLTIDKEIYGEPLPLKFLERALLTAASFLEMNVPEFLEILFEHINQPEQRQKQFGNVFVSLVKKIIDTKTFSMKPKQTTAKGGEEKRKTAATDSKIVDGAEEKEMKEERMKHRTEQKTISKRSHGKILHPEKIEEEKKEEAKLFDEDIFIGNAGLVLLNPFLKQFFTKLSLLNDDGFENTEAQTKAVHFLQFIISNSNENAEHLLPLNKILCGLDVSFPVTKKVEISESEKQICSELIEAVIKNWDKLKNISSQGFIESFVKREGILKIKEEEIFLRVERKAYDILLSQIPWSYSMIKLSWMKKILRVEW